MALVLADRVLETTTTTGSGTITLAGAEPGYQSFSVIGNANQTYYTITTDSDWEVGIGTYTASGTTLSRDTVLASSNSGNRITLAAGSKKVFVTYPAEKSVNFDVSGNITAATGRIINLGAPSLNSDAATKEYVDNMTTAALHIHEAVVLATPASSGRNDTYNNGTAGVSATLTATANGTLVIDSTVAQVAQRVLIKDCDDQAENGVYVVTTVGNGSTAYVMTRASDADTYGEQGANSLDEGSYFFVTGGTSLKGAAFVCNTPGTITFGTTPITFAEFSQAQVYSAGNGISLTATTISLASPVVVSNGGTGLTSTPTNGQLLIGNGTNYTLSTLTAGSGVSITNSAGSITLSATGLGGTVTAVTASSPLASSGGTAPNISIANSTGTGSVVLDQGATISSATITAALSASITTITGSSANITTVTGTTAGFSSANITQLNGTSAGITTVTGTTTTFSSGTITQFGATSATIGTVSGTNLTYTNGNMTSATVTNLNSTSANITTLTGTTFGTTATTQLRGASGAITTLTGTTVTYSSGTITNLAATSITVTNTPAFVGNGTLTMNVSGTGLSGSQTFTANQAGNATFTVTSNATNANTASTIVARDASGNFSAGTITATLNGNASTATTASNVNNGTLTMNVSGTGLSGSQTFTANQSSNATFTVTSNATSANTASTIVARDASGNFSAGTITATLNGNASTATNSTTTSQRAFSGDISTTGQGRFTGWYSGGAATGLATEIGISASQGYIFVYNRDTSTYGTLNVAASSANMQFSGSTINVTSGALQQGGNQVLHAGNYNSYAPTLTGTGASGTWSINVTGSAGTFTNTSQNSQFNSVGVGTAGSGTAGEIRATNNITAYYSDARLKDFKGKISGALGKVSLLNGYYFTENEKAEEFGYNNKELQVGVSAQEVQAVLPEVVAPAPFDMDADNKSKSGENYITVRYEKLVPLLIEAIKELKAEVEALKAAK